MYYDLIIYGWEKMMWNEEDNINKVSYKKKEYEMIDWWECYIILILFWVFL